MAKVYKPIIELRWIHTVNHDGKVISDKVIDYDRSEFLEVFTAKERKELREGGTVSMEHGGIAKPFTATAYKI